MALFYRLSKISAYGWRNQYKWLGSRILIGVASYFKSLEQQIEYLKNLTAQTVDSPRKN